MPFHNCIRTNIYEVLYIPSANMGYYPEIPDPRLPLFSRKPSVLALSLIVPLISQSLAARQPRAGVRADSGPECKGALFALCTLRLRANVLLAGHCRMLLTATHFCCLATCSFTRTLVAAPQTGGVSASSCVYCSELHYWRPRLQELSSRNPSSLLSERVANAKVSRE